MLAKLLPRGAACIAGRLRRICLWRQRRAALRELERVDQAMLDDLGLTRAELVARAFGTDQAACADF